MRSRGWVVGCVVLLELCFVGVMGVVPEWVACNAEVTTFLPLTLRPALLRCYARCGYCARCGPYLCFGLIYGFG